MVVVCAPTDQSSTEDKDHFYFDLESAMTRANGLTIVMGDFYVAIGEWWVHIEKNKQQQGKAGVLCHQ